MVTLALLATIFLVAAAVLFVLAAFRVGASRGVACEWLAFACGTVALLLLGHVG